MERLKHWIGIELDEVSAAEKLVSALGGLVAICLLAALSHQALPVEGAGILVASMGASAVLLFAVPHGPLSQPWPVVAGHGLSALIGVLCARHIPNPTLAAGCAVGLAIGAMHLCKCIHPPGGATALSAVVGGPGITSLGFSFLWMPVLLSALVIVGVAVVFNYAFKWRRYPAAFHRRPKPGPGEVRISHEAVTAALRSLDSFVDISEDDLIRLADLLSKSPRNWPPSAPPGDGI